MFHVKHFYYPLYFWQEIGLRLRNQMKLGRKKYRPKPILHLNQLNLAVAELATCTQLKEKYKVHFESFCEAIFCLENYHLLFVLDQIVQKFSFRPQNQVLVDVGSQSFYYAPALHYFFQPQKLAGIELDGYRIYRSFQTRSSYANFFANKFKNTSYLVKNFLDYQERADLFLFIYPFVTRQRVKSWRLPAWHYQPEKLFSHAKNLIKSDGKILIINHGSEEYQATKKMMEELKMQQVFHFRSENLAPRSLSVEVSLWES